LVAPTNLVSHPATHHQEPRAMSTPSFSPQILGQTEKALNAILDRELAGTGVTEPQWVTLTLAVMSGGTVERSRLVARVADAIKLDPAETEALIAALASAGLLHAGDTVMATDAGGGLDHGAGDIVTVTDAGARLHQDIRTAVTEITGRLWGDLPPEDLATAGDVLRVVLERANAELTRA
jgi:hypothetical protein